MELFRRLRNLFWVSSYSSAVSRKAANIFSRERRGYLSLIGASGFTMNKRMILVVISMELFRRLRNLFWVSPHSSAVSRKAANIFSRGRRGYLSLIGAAGLATNKRMILVVISIERFGRLRNLFWFSSYLSAFSRKAAKIFRRERRGYLLLIGAVAFATNDLECPTHSYSCLKY